MGCSFFKWFSVFILAINSAAFYGQEQNLLQLRFYTAAASIKLSIQKISLKCAGSLRINFE